MTWKVDPDGWRQAYHKDGYVIVEDAVEPELLQQLRDELERIEAEVAADALPEHLRQWVMLERDRTNRTAAKTDAISNIMEIPRFGRVFRDLIVHGRTLDILEALFESPDFSFHNYKAICKMPGGKAPFQWHRDLPYLPHTSPDLITCMLCVDPMTAENGGTVVFPGSHLQAPESVRPEDRDMPDTELPDNAVTVECPAGSAVLFHVNIVHGGGANLTQTKRRNVIGIWAGPDALPTTAGRYAYEFVFPRSADPVRRKQIELTFSQG